MNMLQEFPQLIAVADYAGQRHAGQTRADKTTPYISHPVAVAQMLYNDFGVRDVTTLAAALLHDVLEDTKTTRLDLVAALTEMNTPKMIDSGRGLSEGEIAVYVDALTKEWTGKGPQAQGAEAKTARHLDSYRKLIEPPGNFGRPVPAGVRLIKVADRLHNLQTSFCWKPPHDRKWRGRYLADTALLIGCLSRAAGTLLDMAAVDALKREYWRCVLAFTRPEET